MKWRAGWLVALWMMGLAGALGAQPEVVVPKERPKAPEAVVPKERPAAPAEERPRKEAPPALRAAEAREAREWTSRVLLVTPRLQQLRGEAAEMLRLLGATVVQLGEGGPLLVAGPFWAVDAVNQALAALDPTVRPTALTLTVRTYLATAAPIPNVPQPQNDPFLAQVKENSGYANAVLLHVATLPCVEGETSLTEGEILFQAKEGEAGGRISLQVRPQVMGDQVYLRAKGDVKLRLPPLGNFGAHYEGVAQTSPGQPGMFVSNYPFLQAALVVVFSPTTMRKP